jgi:hypothetical protein
MNHIDPTCTVCGSPAFGLIHCSEGCVASLRAQLTHMQAMLAASEQRAAEATARAERAEAERNEAYELSEQWNEMALDNFDRATTARADGIRAAAEVCEKYGSDGVLRHPLAMRDAVLSLLADGADGEVR